MVFKIIEQETIDYESAKQDYIHGLKGAKLREKYGIGTSAYTRLLKRFREDGITIAHRGRTKHLHEPRYYSRNTQKGVTYFHVLRTINWKVYRFGSYKSEAEAQQRVRELEANNWEGLL